MFIVLTPTMKNDFETEKDKVKNEFKNVNYEPIQIQNGDYILPLSVLSDKHFDKLLKALAKKKADFFFTQREVLQSEMIQGVE